MATKQLPTATGTIIKTRNNRTFEDTGTVGIPGTTERERRWYETGVSKALSHSEMQAVVNEVDGFIVLYDPERLGENESRRPAFLSSRSSRSAATVDLIESSQSAGHSAASKLRADLQTINVVEEGTLLGFTSIAETKRVGGVRRYHYAAVYAGGHWYVTGTPSSRFAGMHTHEAFMELLAQHRETVENVRVATSFEEVL